MEENMTTIYFLSPPVRLNLQRTVCAFSFKVCVLFQTSADCYLSLQGEVVVQPLESVQ